jgi:hypothetical protein
MSERRLDSETDVVDFIRSVEVPAPPSLHDRVDALVAERSAARARWRRPTWKPAFAGALAAGLALIAALAVILATSGGSPQAPSLQAAAALTQRPSTMPAPAQSASHGARLDAAVDGVAFPYWDDRYGWRATGARTDRLDGRSAMTVFYISPRGRRVGYAIVAGAPPRWLAGRPVKIDGVAYHLFTLAGRSGVAWLRGGHLCVITGHSVRDATLLKLASGEAHVAASA